MLSFKGARFPIDVIVVCIRWYVAYPLSDLHLEEIMEELPLIEKMARKHKRPAGSSWRMDEMYIKV